MRPHAYQILSHLADSLDCASRLHKNDATTAEEKVAYFEKQRLNTKRKELPEFVWVGGANDDHCVTRAWVLDEVEECLKKSPELEELADVNERVEDVSDHITAENSLTYIATCKIDGSRTLAGFVNGFTQDLCYGQEVFPHELFHFADRLVKRPSNGVLETEKVPLEDRDLPYMCAYGVDKRCLRHVGDTRVARELLSRFVDNQDLQNKRVVVAKVRAKNQASLTCLSKWAEANNRAFQIVGADRADPNAKPKQHKDKKAHKLALERQAKDGFLLIIHMPVKPQEAPAAAS